MAEKEYIERRVVLEIVKRTNGDYAAAFAEISRLPTADEQEVMTCAEANTKYANDSLEILRQIREKVSSPSDDVAPVVHGEWIVTKTETRSGQAQLRRRETDPNNGQAHSIFSAKP